MDRNSASYLFDLLLLFTLCDDMHQIALSSEMVVYKNLTFFTFLKTLYKMINQSINENNY